MISSDELAYYRHCKVPNCLNLNTFKNLVVLWCKIGKHICHNLLHICHHVSSSSLRLDVMRPTLWPITIFLFIQNRWSNCKIKLFHTKKTKMTRFFILKVSILVSSNKQSEQYYFRYDATSIKYLYGNQLTRSSYG